MRQGKGPAFKRWATVYNLKQIAAALQHIQENKLTDYTRLEAKTESTVDRFYALTEQLRQTEAALATYRAARASMNELLAGAKLSKMDDMKKSRRELVEKRKALYAEYRDAQREMREAVAVKTNIDHLLGVTNGRENKAQER